MKNQIYILGKLYRIEHCDSVQMGGVMGSANRTKQVIKVNTADFAKAQTEETLLHEVLHIINDELVMGLPEETIARLAVGLYSAGYCKSVQPEFIPCA